MNSMQISCFLEVARYLNYNKAAEVLYTTQPVVSYQIKSLEKELKVQLFIRNNRNVTLTPAGTYLFEQLEPIDKRIREIIANAERIQNEEHPKLSLMVRRLADYMTLTNIIHQFTIHNPLAQVDILTQNDQNTRQLLISNEIQLAFCYQFEVYKDSSISFLPLDEAHYFVVVHKDHRLAAFKSLTFDDLAGENLILADTELQKNTQLISLKELERRKITIRPSYTSFDSMLLNVQAGIGFTILPCSRSKKFSGLIKIPLQNVTPMPIGLAWLTSNSDKLVQSFVEHAKKIEFKVKNKEKRK